MTRTSGRDWGKIVFWTFAIAVAGFAVYEVFIGATGMNTLWFLALMILLVFTIFKFVTGRMPDNFASVSIGIAVVAGIVFIFVKFPGLLPFSIQQGPILELKSFVGLP